MNIEDKGYVHVYTGNGKGKTTCALGLALRAVCAGKKVFMGQFVKGMDYSELKAPTFLPNFEMKQYGRNTFIRRNPTDEDIKMGKEAFKDIKKIINSKKYDIVIMDEINIATFFNIIDVDQVVNLIKTKPENVELILTGRYADKKIINEADLVTEMCEVKHYYKTIGLKARIGIEK